MSKTINKTQENAACVTANNRVMTTEVNISYDPLINEAFRNLIKETEKRGANTWMVKNQYKMDDGSFVIDMDADDWDIILVTFNDGHTEELSLYDY